MGHAAVWGEITGLRVLFMGVLLDAQVYKVLGNYIIIHGPPLVIFFWLSMGEQILLQAVWERSKGESWKTRAL